MYGLFRVTFDWYCWEDLVCVSHSMGSLKKYYDNMIDKPKYNLISEEKSRLLIKSKDELNHYTILKIKQIY